MGRRRRAGGDDCSCAAGLLRDVRSAPVRSRSRRHRVTIPLDVVIPLESLTFLPTEDGQYAAKIDIHYAIAGIKSTFQTSGRQQKNIEISEEQYEAREGTNYRFKTGVEVWRGP